MATPPPMVIVNAFEGWVPGIWQTFIIAANVAMVPSDRVTSWWRSEDGNRAAGGHVESQHLVGLAFDVASPNPQRLVTELRRLGFVVVEERTHVHAQAYPPHVLGQAGVFRALFG